MGRAFFILLILGLLIAWIVVGIKNEMDKEEKNAQDSLTVNTSDSLAKYQKITYDSLSFILPSDFYLRNDITNTSDAVLQYSNSSENMFFILYSDTLADDSLAYNYSYINYANSTIQSVRKNDHFTLIDSSETLIQTKQKAIKASYSYQYVKTNGEIDTVQISFITMQNNKKVYMLYWFAYPRDFKNYAETVNYCMSAISLKDK